MKIAITIVATLAFLGIFAGIFIYAGWVNVAADVPHEPYVFKVLEVAREQAIRRDASGLSVPADLSDPKRARRGSGNYDAMCVNCHLSPGQENSEIRRGMYPEPPNLTHPEPATDGVLQSRIRFWVIKHGIKASGMPAWSKGGVSDQAIWDLVAFLNCPPSLDATSYRQLVHASDGHVHDSADHSREEHSSDEHHHEPDQSLH